MARKNHEAAFMREFRTSAEKLYPDSFWYKVPDVGTSGMRFAPQRPFDIYWINNGQIIVMELKSHNKETGWPFDSVKDHQIEFLLKAKKAGACSFIILNVRFGRGAIRFNNTFAININIFLQLKISHGKKSIKPDELFLNNQIIPLRWKYNIWELNRLIDDIGFEFSGNEYAVK